MRARWVRIMVVASLLALAVVPASAASAAVRRGGAPCSGKAETSEIKLMTDWFLWAATGPFAAAIEAGYFEDEGLEVELLPAPDAAAPIKFAARGSVDLALSYIPETLAAVEQQIPVVSVGTTLRVLENALAYWPDTGIETPADLKGKTIGVTSDLQTQVYFDTLLTEAGLTRDDVTIVDPGYSATTSLAERSVDASAPQLVFTDEVRFPALVGDTPEHFLYTDYGVPEDLYWLLIIANDDFAKENPNTVCRFLRATAKGTDKYIADPDAANKLIAKDNDSFPLEVHAAMGANLEEFWKGENGELLKQSATVWKHAQQWALDVGLIEVKNKPSVYFTNKYLPEDLR